MRHIEVETWPASFVVGRNGQAYIKSIRAMTTGSIVSIEGISQHTGKPIHGGFCIDDKAMDELCRQWLADTT